MPQEQLKTIATRNQVYLERYKAGELTKFDEFLRAMANDVNSILARDDITEFTRSRMETLISQVGVMMGRSFDEYHTVWKNSIDELSMYQAGFEARALESVVDGVVFAIPSDSQIMAAVYSTPIGVIKGATGGSLLEPFFAGMTQTEIDRVQGAIRLGYAEGQTTAQIMQRVKGTKAAGYTDGLWDTTKRNVAAVVRTSLQHAASYARDSVWQENKSVIKGVEWVSTLDSRTSSQCFPESVEVSPAGILENVFRANYSGEIVIITTASGKKLEGTSNHPVLTTGGFLPLHELKEGQKIVSAVLPEMLNIAGDKNISMPSKIGELFDALNEPPIMDIGSVCATAIDFYGDGARMHGEIDILPVNSHLSDDFIASANQNIINKLLCFIKLSNTSFCDRHSDFFTVRHFPVDMSTKISAGTIKASINSALGSANHSPDGDWLMSVIKQLDDSESISLHILIMLASLKGWHDSILLEKTSNCSGGSAELPTNGGSTCAFSVEFDNIVSVHSEFRSCHVYTLSDSLGFYTANGFIVKNCRSLDGQVFPLDKGPRPPAHINCRSTTAAALKGKYTGLMDDMERSSRDPETGKVKYVSADETYYSWLKKQPAAFQDSVVGPTRGQLMRNGGLSSERFAELQLGKTFEPLTLEQMRKLEPLAFQKAGL